MKFFGWMQNKFNGGHGHRQQNAVSASTHHKRREGVNKEEFSDWPGSLLAIGTFGNNDLKETAQKELNLQNEQLNPNINCDDDDEEENEEDHLSKFTAEEVDKLQKELTKLLSRKPPTAASKKALHDQGEISMSTDHLPLDKFLNCPSSLEVDRRLSTTLSSCNSDSSKEEEDIDRTIRAIIGRCKDICENNKRKSIGKKSVSFLFKKMFACTGGFVPAPNIRDTLQESRMEKLLKTMLSKKIYSQNSSRVSSMKRFLKDRKTQKEDDEMPEKAGNDHGCKWVKTDSEYIVLEI